MREIKLFERRASSQIALVPNRPKRNVRTAEFVQVRHMAAFWRPSGTHAAHMLVQQLDNLRRGQIIGSNLHSAWPWKANRTTSRRHCNRREQFSLISCARKQLAV